MKLRHELQTQPVEWTKVILQQRVAFVALGAFALANLILLWALKRATGDLELWAWLLLCVPFAVLGAAIRLAEDSTPPRAVGESEVESDPIGRTAAAVRELSKAAGGDGRARILLVDDSALNRRVARRVLEQEGYRVDEASDGQEACQAAAALRYDLILMDVHMPRRDGFEAARTIRNSKGASAKSPILALTARALGEDLQPCLDAGMDGHVNKPVRGPALLAAVESWVEMDMNTHSTFVLDEQEAQDDLPILAPGALDELRSFSDGDDDSMLLELAQMFFRGAQENIATMRESFESRDMHSFERAAHSLKGSSGTLGAQRLSERCRQLEFNARGGSLPDSIEEIDALKGMVGRIREALEANLGIRLG